MTLVFCDLDKATLNGEVGPEVWLKQDRGQEERKWSWELQILSSFQSESEQRNGSVGLLGYGKWCLFYFYFLINWKIPEHDNAAKCVIQQRGKEFADAAPRKQLQDRLQSMSGMAFLGNIQQQKEKQKRLLRCGYYCRQLAS